MKNIASGDLLQAAHLQPRQSQKTVCFVVLRNKNDNLTHIVIDLYTAASAVTGNRVLSAKDEDHEIANETEPISSEDTQILPRPLSHNTAEQPEVEKNLEDFSLVWCDENVASEENERIQLELRKSINFLKTYQTIVVCKMYVQQCTQTKIVLIVAGGLGQILVPEVHNLPHILSIYVYCRNKAKHEQWTSGYGKVARTFSHEKGS